MARINWNGLHRGWQPNNSLSDGSTFEWGVAAWGPSLWDDIIGTDGDDSLVGTAGNDRIEGLKGADTLDGQSGNDKLFGDQGRDTLLGGEGLDALNGGAGNDSLDGGLGADKMAGGTGNDSFVVDDLADVVSEREGGGTDTVKSSVDWTLGVHTENLVLASTHGHGLRGTGNALANDMHGGYGYDVLEGGDGDDTIEGGLGIAPGSRDTMWGGAGNDSISSGGGQPHSDEIHGGIGNDTLNGTGSSYGDEGDDLLVGAFSQYGGVGNDTIRGGRSIDGGEGDDLIDTQQGLTTSGGDGNDTITGGGGEHSAYQVDAGSGNDVLNLSASLGLKAQMGDGDDTVSVGCIGGLEVNGGAGRDHIEVWVSGGEFAIDGGAGGDTIWASGPNGTINGGGGNDTLSLAHAGWIEGGVGNDTLSLFDGLSGMTGGAGNDTFLLAAEEDSQNDMLLVLDYELDFDRVAIDQSNLRTGNGDTQVDGATVIDGPGGFDTGAELVIVAEDIFGSLTLDAAAAAIGSANQAYATGQTAAFVVGNGSDTWVLRFESSGHDALVSAAELSILGRIDNGSKLQIDDVIFTA